ncbi:hypothetical protein CR513_03261, partial [Mucuna pruriens]
MKAHVEEEFFKEVFSSKCKEPQIIKVLKAISRRNFGGRVYHQIGSGRKFEEGLMYELKRVITLMAIREFLELVEKVKLVERLGRLECNQEELSTKEVSRPMVPLMIDRWRISFLQLSRNILCRELANQTTDQVLLVRWPALCFLMFVDGVNMFQVP